jgi:hypothetical protein
MRVRLLRTLGGTLAGLALLFMAPSPSRAAPPAPTEYQLKAVFLFNFAQFVEWPASAFSDPATPLVIGVLGQDPFGPALDETVQGETAAGRPLVIRRYRRVDEIDACHVLFISQSESARLDAVLSSLGSRSILTVGDAENYARRGVMIRFMEANKKLRLRINLDAARTAGLVISSKLLRNAEVISGKEGS